MYCYAYGQILNVLFFPANLIKNFVFSSGYSWGGIALLAGINIVFYTLLINLFFSFLNAIINNPTTTLEDKASENKGNRKAIDLKLFIPINILYLALRILLIFPIYQITLPLVGWMFGQFKFFWNLEKKMLQRMGLGRFFK